MTSKKVISPEERRSPKEGDTDHPNEKGTADVVEFTSDASLKLGGNEEAAVRGKGQTGLGRKKEEGLQKNKSSKNPPRKGNFCPKKRQRPSKGNWGGRPSCRESKKNTNNGDEEKRNLQGKKKTLAEEGGEHKLKSRAALGRIGICEGFPKR